MRIELLNIGVRERFRHDLGDINQLCQDMKDTGQITAITVRPTSDDDREEGFVEEWMLVAGGRRLHAALSLGWPDIEAMTLAELPPLERSIMELHENLYRKELTWDEEVDLKTRIHQLRLVENPSHQQYETAQELKETPANVSRDLRLAEELETHPELRKASSKKAAQRMVDMKKHIEKLESQEDRGITMATKLRDRIQTADAREWIRKLPDHSVDLVYSDPPWGIGYWQQGHKMSGNRNASENSLGGSEYDDSYEAVFDVITDVFPQMVRVCKPTGWIVLHGGFDAMMDWRKLFASICRTHNDYCGTEGSLPQKGDCVYIKPEPIPWIWHRPNSNNKSRFPELHEQNRYEYILPFNMGEAKLLRPNEGNVLTYDAEYGQRIHAMQKPIELCKDVISRFTFPKYTVIDPFFGSGALLAAGAALGRDIRGCEQNGLLRDPAIGYIAQYFTGA